MAQITPDAQYIFEESVRSDAAVSESAFQTIGGSINYLLDEVSTLDGKTLKIQEFLSNGTLNVPSDVSILLVEGCGGGGGGAGGAGAGQQGRGGSGAPFVSRIVSVTPGSSHAVTIGTGGAGGAAAAATFGGNGTDTTLGSLVICRGAAGGGNTVASDPNFISPSNGYVGGVGSATQGANGAGRGASTENGFYGGTPANSPTDTIGGGGGGAGPFGNGGNGGKLNTIAPQNAAANTGAGGGGGTGFFGGGSGGSGRLRVTYLSKF